MKDKRSKKKKKFLSLKSYLFEVEGSLTFHGLSNKLKAIAYSTSGSLVSLVVKDFVVDLLNDSSPYAKIFVLFSYKLKSILKRNVSNV